MLGVPGEAGAERDVRARLATLYRCDTSSWEHVATYPVPAALLPAMPAPHRYRLSVL
ncbi:MAG: hypothetical protein ACRD0L_17830 [Acidimicrobiales bacterium]